MSDNGNFMSFSDALDFSSVLTFDTLNEVLFQWSDQRVSRNSKNFWRHRKMLYKTKIISAGHNVLHDVGKCDHAKYSYCYVQSQL